MKKTRGSREMIKYVHFAQRRELDWICGRILTLHYSTIQYLHQFQRSTSLIRRGPAINVTLSSQNHLDNFRQQRQGAVFVNGRRSYGLTCFIPIALLSGIRQSMAFRRPQIRTCVGRPLLADDERPEHIKKIQ